MMQPQSWTAIFAAAAAAWLFGAIWYGLLGRLWAAAQGETMETLKVRNAGRSAAAKAAPFVLSFLAEIVMAAALSGVLFHSSMMSVRQGMIAGALIWLGFVLTTILVNNAYTFRSLKLTAIDAGHWLGVLVIIGAVVAWLT